MSAHRGKIRRYIVDMLRETVDVGGRVFANRPTSAVFQHELPVVLVYFEDEDNQVWVGDSLHQKVLRKNLEVNVTTVVENIYDPTANLDDLRMGEDYLDFLVEQVEDSLHFDHTLARRLPEFDPNHNFLGLVQGSMQSGSTTYEVETDGERSMIANTLKVTYAYERDTFKDKRFASFDEYLAEIVKVGATSETVDPVLIAAQGRINS